jgi:hypothetical protein
VRRSVHDTNEREPPKRAMIRDEFGKVWVMKLRQMKFSHVFENEKIMNNLPNLMNPKSPS